MCIKIFFLEYNQKQKSRELVYRKAGRGFGDLTSRNAWVKGWESEKASDDKYAKSVLFDLYSPHSQRLTGFHLQLDGLKWDLSITILSQILNMNFIQNGYQPGLISWDFHVSILPHSTSPVGNCALWDLFCHHNLTQCFLLGFPSSQLVDDREENRTPSAGLLSYLTAAYVRFHTCRGQSTMLGQRSIT